MNTYRKPIMTHLFLGMNIIYFLYMLLRFGTTQSTVALLEAGANYTPMIVIRGEWWRLLSAAFIHIGPSHLIMNGLTLYFLGQDLEAIMGSARFACLYILAAIGGNLFSYAFSVQTVSAGASTAIFGLFAAYVCLGRMYSHIPLLRQRAATYSILILINFVNGFLAGGVDNWGHLGGGVFGFFSTILLGLPTSNPTSQRNRLIAALILVVLTVLTVSLGYWQTGLFFR